MSHNGNYVKLILSVPGRVSPPYCPASHRHTGFPNEILYKTPWDIMSTPQDSHYVDVSGITNDQAVDAEAKSLSAASSALPFPVRPVCLNPLPEPCLLVALLPGQVRGTLYAEDAPVRSMALACMAFHPNHEQLLNICGMCR